MFAFWWSKLKLIQFQQRHSDSFRGAQQGEEQLQVWPTLDAGSFQLHKRIAGQNFRARLQQKMAATLFN